MRIKYFNRYELKYVLHREQAEQIGQDLMAYLQPDLHGGKSGRYAITSLYYDTPDYRAYWDKIEGHRFRRKLRIRVYDNPTVTPDTDCFVEIKQRNNKSLQKKRIILPYQAAIDLCNTGQAVTLESESDQAVMREVQYLTGALQLQPSCVVSYDRQAFNGGDYDPGLRITFDTNLKGRTHDLTLLSSNTSESQYFLPPNLSIMEVKVNNRVPYWLTEFLGQYRCTLQRVSKYCTALEKSKVLLQEQQVLI